MKHITTYKIFESGSKIYSICNDKELYQDVSLILMDVFDKWDIYSIDVQKLDKVSAPFWAYTGLPSEDSERMDYNWDAKDYPTLEGDIKKLRSVSVITIQYLPSNIIVSVKNDIDKLRDKIEDITGKKLALEIEPNYRKDKYITIHLLE